MFVVISAFEGELSTACVRRGQVFEDLPLEQDILFFIRDLGYTGDITYLTDVNVSYLHQPWRAFATVINKCLSGKETGMDNIRLSCAQILWDHKVTKRKDPKPKYIRKKVDSDTSPKKKPVQATKGTRLNSKAKVAKPDKKKQPAENTKAKGLAVLSEVALTKVEQLKLATKRSKKDFHSSHASGSGDGVNTQSKVPDEQQQKTSGADKGTGDSEDKDDNDDDGDSDNHDDAKEEEENIDDEETMYDDEDDEVTKELYEDVNVNLGNVDTDITNADQVHDTQNADEPIQSSFVSFDFTSKLLNLENPSPIDNEIGSLMETSDQTTTLLPALPDFAYVFKFNERVFNLEKDVSEIKQVDQYAQALSSIPAIVDHYMDNKLREAINKAILAHNLDCRQEAQDEKNAYIELVDTSIRALIKEEVNTQLPQILPQAVSDFATPVIEKNVTELVEVAVLTRSSSQPTSTYEAAASLFEFELTKILIDKMEKKKSYDKADYKKKLYDALVESYNTDKDLFDSYGEDRGKKRRKSSKDADSSRDSRSKEKKSSSTSKYEFVMGDNDEQLADKEVTKADWFKKLERPPTPNPDWSKRRQVDFRPPQTWISQVVHVEEPPTSFDEFNDTSFDFSAFVINRLKILNLTQEILKASSINFDLERQIIPKDYFINKDLEYLKGGDLSRRYSTSVTKSKAATYELQWIKDLVPELWSLMQVKYDQHAYFVTLH
ncbi:hypothetical protein Tco_0352581 [Tanacetum coccineum]